MKNDSDIERLLAAMRCENIDEVPNFEITMQQRNLTAILNRPVQDGLGGIFPEVAVEVALAIRQDAIPCSVRMRGNPEARIIRSGSIQTLADFEREAAMPGFDVVRKNVRCYLSAVEGTGLGVCATLSGPLTQSYMAAGPVPIQSFMYLLYDDPELVNRLLDFFTEYALRVIAAIEDLPFHFYYIGDDVAGLFGSEALSTLWKPRQSKIMAAAKSSGRPVLCHCCGPVAEILPFLEEWSIDALHPIQTDVNDIYDIRRKYPKLALFGNIGVNLLSTGTPDQVAAETNTHIARLGPGYVVGSSHSIIDSVRPENFLAMLECAWATRSN